MRKRGASFTRALRLAGACAPLAWLALSSAVAQGQEAPGGGVHQTLDGLISNHCVKCHNATDWAGGLALDTVDLRQVAEAPDVWEKTINKLRGRLMPPAGESQPGQADVDAVIGYLEKSIDAAASHRRVGHVPIQRLNRTEFAASVKALLGVDIDARQLLPTEIEVEGFDNIADALGISPSFLEQYLSAVRRVARLAVGEPLPKMASVFYGGGGGGGGQAGPGSITQYVHKDGYPLGTRGGVSFTHVFPADGEYRFNFMEGDSIDAGLYPRGMETSATLVVLVDGEEVARRQIGGPEDLAIADRDGPAGREALVAKVSGIPAYIKAGAHTVTVTFIERSWALSNDPTGGGFGGGKVSGMPIIRDGVQVVGPFSPQGLSLSESRARIFICQPASESEERPCAEKIARHLATQAFRRPVTNAEVERLMKFYDVGRGEPGGFDSGVTELIIAILSSPDFLYRAISTAPTPGESRLLTQLELASRLSFFLWSQGPDKELIELAANNRLADPAVLQQQVDRMLADPRARSLIENFALAWLNLDELEQVEPQDRTFNAEMRANFETEIRLFLQSVLLEDRSVLDLLNADWTFVNESLARHYGIRGVRGPQFRRVKLEDENRWGLLGKGAVLLRTSYGDRTSPVLRGAWVLERLMGTPPAPPPPNVETDLSVPEGQKPTTVRARLEVHRANPSCNACHGIIDPPGLALENFDVTGRWRDVDPAAKEPIDPRTELSSGVTINGPADLRRYLTSRPDQFPTTVTRRLMMYALNREIEYFDMPQVREIVRQAASSNYTLRSLVMGIVNSDSFRRQAPEEHAHKVAFSASRGADTTQPLHGR
jgi:mono/diheme cytochrome c family protein